MYVGSVRSKRFVGRGSVDGWMRWNGEFPDFFLVCLLAIECGEDEPSHPPRCGRVLAGTCASHAVDEYIL